MVALYRHWGEDGSLLYVGISCNVGVRTSQHAKAAHWFHLVQKITVDNFPDRQSAMNAEAIAIFNEKPKYNIVRPSIPNDQYAKCNMGGGRNKFIKVRVSEEEYLEWKLAAKMAGMTLSDFIREALGLFLQPPHLTAQSQPGHHAPGQPQET